MRVVIAFSLGLAALASAGAAQAETAKPSSISLSVRLSKLKLRQADILISDVVGAGPILGQTVDYIDDFGVDDGPKRFYGVRGTLAYGSRVKVRGGFQRVRFGGNDPVPMPIGFAGYVIPGGTFVDSKTRFDFFEVGIEWAVIDTQMFRAALMFEPKIVNLRVRTTGSGQEGGSGPAVSFREKEEEIVPIPAVGATIDFRPIDNFGIRAEAKGIRMPLTTRLFDNIEKVETFDWEVEGTIYFGEAAGLTFGYRSVLMKIELDNKGLRHFASDVKFRGWFAALDLKF